MPEILQEKECAACGAFFTPTHGLQKYCPNCGHNGSRIRKRIENRVRLSANTEQKNEPKEHICPQCGKKFVSYYNRLFCSDACKIQNKKLNMACGHCGKKIIDIREPTEKECRSAHPAYCSDKCRNQAKKEKDIARFGVKKCMNCGEEFISPNARFCSRQCAQEWSAHHKEKMNKAKICANCGQHYTSHNARFCSKKCYADYMRQHPAEKNTTVPTESEQEKAIKKEQASRARMEKYIQENGMCGICRTSYVDCRRMQSNFTYSPEGCIIKNNKVIQCPQFLPPKKF